MRGATAERSSYESTVRVRHRAAVCYLTFLTCPGDASASRHGNDARSVATQGSSNVATAGQWARHVSSTSNQGAQREHSRMHDMYFLRARRRRSHPSRSSRRNFANQAGSFTSSSSCPPHPPLAFLVCATTRATPRGHRGENWPSKQAPPCRPSDDPSRPLCPSQFRPPRCRSIYFASHAHTQLAHGS